MLDGLREKMDNLLRGGINPPPKRESPNPPLKVTFTRNPYHPDNLKGPPPPIIPPEQLKPN